VPPEPEEVLVVQMTHEEPGPAAAPAEGRLPDATAELYAKFFRGLGDPTRVKIIQLLLERPRTVSELVTILGVPQGRVSAHLGCLRWCGFAAGVREGRTVVYQVVDPRVRTLLATAQDLLRQHAERVACCVIIDTAEYRAPAPP